MHKLKSPQNSQPASINPPKETLQDFLTRTALEYKEGLKASQMKLYLQHFPATNNDTAHELLK